MKLLMEQWKKYLAEIGDSSVEPYPFKLHRQFNDGDVFFEFKSDTGLQYYVNFTLGIGPPRIVTGKHQSLLNTFSIAPLIVSLKCLLFSVFISYDCFV